MGKIIFVVSVVLSLSGCCMVKPQLTVARDEYAKIEKDYVKYVKADSTLDPAQKANRMEHAQDLRLLLEELLK